MLVKMLVFIAGGSLVWLFHHINMNETHDLWKAAYQAGYLQAQEFYQGILEVENAPEVLDAKCMFRNFQWKEEHNSRGKTDG